jgi:hypothetical protein
MRRNSTNICNELLRGSCLGFEVRTSCHNVHTQSQIKDERKYLEILTAHTIVIRKIEAPIRFQVSRSNKTGSKVSYKIYPVCINNSNTNTNAKRPRPTTNKRTKQINKQTNWWPKQTEISSQIKPWNKGGHTFRQFKGRKTKTYVYTFRSSRLMIALEFSNKQIILLMHEIDYVPRILCTYNVHTYFFLQNTTS